MALPTRVNRGGYTDPFAELQQEFDTVLNRFFGGRGGTPQTPTGRRSAPYAVDVHEDENHLYFEVELPGFKKEDLDITLDNNVLTITAERSAVSNGQPRGEASEGEQAPRRETLLNERRYTYFSRSFSLPPTVNNENVHAHLEDGVLHLTLDKREETKPRKIQIQ